MTAFFIDSGLQYGNFLNTDISQGSVVTQLRCGGMTNDDFVANLLVNLSVKELWKSVNIWRRYGQYYSGLFFFIDSQCTHAECYYRISSNRSPRPLLVQYACIPGSACIQGPACIRGNRIRYVALAKSTNWTFRNLIICLPRLPDRHIRLVGRWGGFWKLLRD